MNELTIPRRAGRGQQARVLALSVLAVFAGAAILRAMTLAEFISLKFEPHVVARREAGGQKHYRFWVRKPHSLAVRENWYEGKRGPLKRGTRRRNVPITPELARRLAGLERRATDPDAPLFQGRRAGRPVDAHNVANRVFRPLGKQLGFSVTWYGFRLPIRRSRPSPAPAWMTGSF
jgi:hypothetical protein